MLFVPLFAEQAHNAVQMTTLGIASFLNKYTLSKAVVYKELKKVFTILEHDSTFPDTRYPRLSNKDGQFSFILPGQTDIRHSTCLLSDKQNY